MIPTVRQILDIYGLQAQKQLSQNFILNGALLDRIALMLTADAWPKATESSVVIEIGPGPGSLTRSLIKHTQPSKVLAIELDKRFEPVLNVMLKCIATTKVLGIAIERYSWRSVHSPI